MNALNSTNTSPAQPSSKVDARDMYKSHAWSTDFAVNSARLYEYSILATVESLIIADSPGLLFYTDSRHFKPL
jgi:hypothetical protein